MTTTWDIRSLLTVTLDNEQSELLRDLATQSGKSPVEILEDIVESNSRTILSDIFDHEENIKIDEIICHKRTAGWI